ncbi:MAG TPA: hypothetical protein VGL62_07020 [Vicinamibacterales bacterium]|jgi:hypothetical protein
MRALLGVAACCAISAVLAAHPRTAPQSATDVFDGTSTVELTLTAPLRELFTKSEHDQKYFVTGSVSYRDAAGVDTTIDDVDVGVRGHTSQRECSFPKLKIDFHKGAPIPAPFTGLSGFKIGTHCGENPIGARTSRFGRLGNETSPLREALAYRLLDTAGVPALRTRPARITYVDSSPGAGRSAPLVRDAILIEDEGTVRERLGGPQISLEAFGNVQRRDAAPDALRIAFGEAMIGNFDWCLRFFPGDLYRCDDFKPLWNIDAFARPGGGAALLANDFDLAGIVVGRHAWFEKVYNAGFVPSRSPMEVEVLSQVQRTRSLFDRAALDAERRRLIDRRPAVLAAIDEARIDAQGRDLARAFVSTFYDDIGDDRAFYRPVVVKLNVQMYADPSRAREACGPRDVIPIGTPVNEVQHSGSMSQVMVLDALWRWAPPRQCTAVRTGSVWISSDAISADYPRR